MNARDDALFRHPLKLSKHSKVNDGMNHLNSATRSEKSVFYLAWSR